MLHTKLIGRIALALSIASFSGVNLSAYAVQEAGSSDRNHGGAPNEPADDSESIAPAARLWRSLTLSYGSTRHHYREPDPLGRVDPLDSETGSIPTTPWLLSLRYEAQRMSLGASPTVAGLQYPGSSNNTQSLAVSLGHHF